MCCLCEYTEYTEGLEWNKRKHVCRENGLIYIHALICLSRDISEHQHLIAHFRCIYYGQLKVRKCDLSCITDLLCVCIVVGGNGNRNCTLENESRSGWMVMRLVCYLYGSVDKCERRLRIAFFFMGKMEWP